MVSSVPTATRSETVPFRINDELRYVERLRHERVAHDQMIALAVSALTEPRGFTPAGPELVSLRHLLADAQRHATSGLPEGVTRPHHGEFFLNDVDSDRRRMVLDDLAPGSDVRPVGPAGRLVLNRDELWTLDGPHWHAPAAALYRFVAGLAAREQLL